MNTLKKYRKFLRTLKKKNYITNLVNYCQYIGINHNASSAAKRLNMIRRDKMGRYYFSPKRKADKNDAAILLEYSNLITQRKI